jgi:outer membrane protein OmpA-like peptidoglycan-associated protein
MKGLRIFRVLSGLTLFASLLTLPVVAKAQTRTPARFDANRFEPAERGSDWFVLDSLDFRGGARPAFGITAQYAHRPLEIYDQTAGVRSEGTSQVAPIRNQLMLHPGLSFVLANRIRLGATLPVQLIGEGQDGVRKDYEYRAPERSVSVGDLRLAADVRIFGEYGDNFTLSAGLRGYVPIGDQKSYLSDGEHLRLSPRVQIAGIGGPFHYAAYLGVNFRDIKSFGEETIGHELSYGLAAGFAVLHHRLLIGPEIFGATTLSRGQAWKHYTSPVEGLLGAHWLDGSGRFGGGVGVGFNDAYGAPDVRAVLGFEFFPYKPIDKDGDGIEDKDDACRTEPGVKSDDHEKNGCPAEAAAPGDKDHDGVADNVDACPDTAGSKNADPAKNGCPLPPSPTDKDGDGIADADDACADVAGVASTDPKKNGCPADKDGDGIVDSEDACVDVAGVKSSDAKQNGCPVDPDRDKDGVPNAEDACPDAAGPKNSDPEKNGCPMAALQNGVIKIREQVKFKTGSAEIEPGKDSEEILLAVEKVLKDHPEIKKLRVEGHTDNKGNAKTNQKLSADRAAAVVKWLVKRGIEGARLSSAGFGQERPIQSNDTEDGRRHNRRVEFHVE